MAATTYTINAVKYSLARSGRAVLLLHYTCTSAHINPYTDIAAIVHGGSSVCI